MAVTATLHGDHEHDDHGQPHLPGVSELQPACRDRERHQESREREYQQAQPDFRSSLTDSKSPTNHSAPSVVTQ